MALALTLPIYVAIPRKTKADKKVALNMNTYRNLHYMTSNQAKIVFKEHVRGLLEKSPSAPKPPVSLTYTLYQQSNRSTDVANVLSIVDKFTCDALVELGVFEDDNYRFIPEVTYRYGGVDKLNPRAELTISSIEEQENHGSHEGGSAESVSRPRKAIRRVTHT